MQYSLDDLQRVMERLRDPDGGCPWDQKQSFRSIITYTLEECYELAEAIELEDLGQIEEELGDVLFQVVFLSQLGKELGAFDLDAVADGLVHKLVRRHPHVFAGITWRTGRRIQLIPLMTSKKPGSNSNKRSAKLRKLQAYWTMFLLLCPPYPEDRSCKSVLLVLDLIGKSMRR